MPLKRETLERQLRQANEALDAWKQTLRDGGIEPGQFSRDPKWRSLNARVNKIRQRLDSVASVAEINAEAERRKADKVAAQSAE